MYDRSSGGFVSHYCISKKKKKRLIRTDTILCLWFDRHYKPLSQDEKETAHEIKCLNVTRLDILTMHVCMYLYKVCGRVLRVCVSVSMCLRPRAGVWFCVCFALNVRLILSIHREKRILERG